VGLRRAIGCYSLLDYRHHTNAPFIVCQGIESLKEGFRLDGESDGVVWKRMREKLNIGYKSIKVITDSSIPVRHGNNIPTIDQVEKAIRAHRDFFLKIIDRTIQFLIKNNDKYDHEALPLGFPLLHLPDINDDSQDSPPERVENLNINKIINFLNDKDENFFLNLPDKQANEFANIAGKLSGFAAKLEEIKKRKNEEIRAEALRRT
jgi:hypothetical protein